MDSRHDTLDNTKSIVDHCSEGSQTGSRTRGGRNNGRLLAIIRFLVDTHNVYIDVS
jgi:hypothetical protein